MKFVPNKIIRKGNKVRILLTTPFGKFKESAIIDKKDYNNVKDYRWSMTKLHYVSSKTREKNVYLHHLIMGKPKKGFEIDHINENPLDNTRKNLRTVNRSINNLNRKGSKGCWFRKDTKKWAAEIKVEGKKISLGCYNTFKEAKKVRDTFKVKAIKEQLLKLEKADAEQNFVRNLRK